MKKNLFIKNLNYNYFVLTCNRSIISKVCCQCLLKLSKHADKSRSSIFSNPLFRLNQLMLQALYANII